MSIAKWKALTITGLVKTCLCGGVVYFSRKIHLDHMESYLVDVSAICLGGLALVDFSKSTELLLTNEEEDNNKKTKKD